MITFDEEKFKSYVVETTITEWHREDEDGWFNFKVTVDIWKETVEVLFTFYMYQGRFVYPNDWQDFEYIHEAGKKIFGLLYNDESNRLSEDFPRFIYKLGVAEYKEDLFLAGVAEWHTQQT